MGRLGLLEEWLQATVREAVPAVCFSSCFPFLNELGMVVPPRTLWPPKATSLASARVRWKSARFVPLDVVRAILSGEPLNEDDWTVDGASECLVPTGRPGPFRTGVRWNAAVDRLTGVSERHATGCIEFRPGAGLWTIAGFRDGEAHSRWLEPVKAAFRLLADSGFGGERSRGWGRSEQPEFIDGSLPDMILPAAVAMVEEAKAVAQETITPESEPLLPPAPELMSAPIEPSPVPPIQDPPVELPPGPDPNPDPEPPPPDPDPQPPAPEPEPPMPDPPFPEPSPVVVTAEPATLAAAASASETELPAVPEPVAAVPELEPEPEAEPMVQAEVTLDAVAPAPLLASPRPEEIRPAVEKPGPLWLLSLFTPAAADAVDWRRGNYTVLARGGRVDSPSGSGELKKQVQMVVEGSVLYAEGDPSGAAPDVAPEGFAHPVFRAGFALAIPLPEVS
jgi:hypothetical protein